MDNLILIVFICMGKSTRIQRVKDDYSAIMFVVVNTVKHVLSGHSKITPKLVFNTNCRLMQFKSIAECSKGSILQYFRPTLSYHFPLLPLFCLF